MRSVDGGIISDTVTVCTSTPFLLFLGVCDLVFSRACSLKAQWDDMRVG